MRISDWSSDVCSSDLHVPNRGWESDASLPAAAREAGCSDIASQFIDFVRERGAPQVVLAGGAPEFLPDEEVMRGVGGKRKDGRRAEERRVGQACGGTCRARWWPVP